MPHLASHLGPRHCNSNSNVANESLDSLVSDKQPGEAPPGPHSDFDRYWCTALRKWARVCLSPSQAFQGLSDSQPDSDGVQLSWAKSATLMMSALVDQTPCPRASLGSDSTKAVHPCGCSFCGRSSSGRRCPGPSAHPIAPESIDGFADDSSSLYWVGPGPQRLSQ